VLKEIAHFVRVAPAVVKLQKGLPRAEFTEALNAQANEQGYAAIRSELVDGLSGRVLEVGCGTGSMFEYYPPAVERLDAIEPEADFRALAVTKAEASNGRIQVTAGDGMALTFADQSFDAVVFGLVLCSVPSVKPVVSEAFRVLRPGGSFRALEHVRSARTVPGALMDFANPLWLKINGQGCNWNRDPLPAIRAQGFVVDDVKEFQRFDTIVPAFLMRQVRAHRPHD
jgi:ubiquinone/menaquinone biosynthesis C-methylase UbiE